MFKAIWTRRAEAKAAESYSRDYDEALLEDQERERENEDIGRRARYAQRATEAEALEAANLAYLHHRSRKAIGEPIQQKSSSSSRELPLRHLATLSAYASEYYSEGYGLFGDCGGQFDGPALYRSLDRMSYAHGFYGEHLDIYIFELLNMKLYRYRYFMSGERDIVGFFPHIEEVDSQLYSDDELRAAQKRRDEFYR